MTSEDDWVISFSDKLNNDFLLRKIHGATVKCFPHKRLAYSHEVSHYDSTDAPVARKPARSYQTDLLIKEIREDSTWVPRVVIECKFGDSKISTHDALTYSSKAATHKQIHPYLRYGIILAAFNNSLPYRLVSHGTNFDFMFGLSAEKLTPEEWACLTKVLRAEVKASLTLEEIFSTSSDRTKYWALHKALEAY